MATFKENELPRKNKHKGYTQNDVEIYGYGYHVNNETMGDKEYFFCRCKKCGYRDILTVDQMKEHVCKEEDLKDKPV